MTRSVEDLNLIKLLHGKRTINVPFWEVWFGMIDFVKRRYNSDMVKAAKDLGWDALSLGEIDTNVRFAASCNTSPLDYIPDENYLAMADVIRHF